MKAIEIEGVGKTRYKNVRKPKCKKGEALIKVFYSGICGSDLLILLGKINRVTFPLIPGHEFSGIVEEIDPVVKTDIKKGDKVSVNPVINCQKCNTCKSGLYHICENLKLIGIDSPGGLADYVSVPIDAVHKLPYSFSLINAALIEPLAVAVHTVRRSPLKLGDTVFVLGAGPIGNLIAQIATVAGAQKVLLVEKNIFRANIAKKMGFELINDINSASSSNFGIQNKAGVVPDIIFDTTGSIHTINLFLKKLKRRGTLIIISIPKILENIEFMPIVMKELQFLGSRLYNRQDFKKAIYLIHSNIINVKEIITPIIPLEEFQNVIDKIKHGGDIMKTLLYPKHTDTSCR